MTLSFKHFDTRLNQWITNENPSLVDEPILTEKLDNTLLELYFPNQQFSFGHIDEKSTVDNLYKHPDNHVLLLSSSSRLLYGSPDCLETIEKLCPDRKDRGAYGSIFLGSCKNAVFKEMNILVVDDATGKNGGVLADDVAWKQVGDCHGKISPQLATELSGTVEHVIQHRLGIPDQFRFAKGTLAPKNLSQLPYKEPNTHVDLIVPTSSFKGGDKKSNPFSPGLHTVKVWIGEKELSHKGKEATSQVHASFPEGVKDYVRDLSDQAKELQKLASDSRRIAEHYCYKYEKRQEEKELTKTQNRSFSSENEPEYSIGDAEPTIADQQNDDLMYRILKTELESGHTQLLETQKVIDSLKRFLQKEWSEIAIGKTITFDRGMIIPSKDLKHGEICVSWLDEGEEVLNFRSPLLNSNGMCVSLNKHVKDAFAPNGEPLKGVIVVNDEDHKRITARINDLKAQGFSTDEIDPIETESERQGRDYDGDCIGVALAKNFPNLTAEAKKRNEPENAYSPVKKEDKVSFYRSDGSQPPFEEIALFMSDSISVGVINNHATALEALESEIDILRKYGTLEQKSNYVRLVGTHYQKLLAQEEDRQSPKPIPPQYRSRIAQIAQVSQSSLTPDSINTVLTINRSIYHDMIGEAGYQNQIAVDIFKSNRAPDMDAIANNNRLLHRIPNYIRDKKKPGMYINKGIEPLGFSPVELMVRQANTHFSESALVARPTEQFRDLFSENYTPAQYNQALLAKAEFDKLFNAASIVNQKLRHETGPVLKVSTTSGKQLEITNLTRFDHPQAFSAKKLNLKLVENKTPGAYHKLLALAQINGQVDKSGNPVYQKLGTVCEISRGLEGLQPGMMTEQAEVKLASPLTKKQIQLKFQQTYEYAESFASSIASSELSAMAAATWHICTTSDNQKNANSFNKISNFAFAAFGEEIIRQLKELQFNRFVVAELRQHNETPDALWRNGSEVSLFIKANKDQRFWYVLDPTTGTDHKLGVLSPKGAQLPVGTIAKGTIRGDATATATLNLPGIDQPITFGKMGDHEFSTRQFNGESVKVTLKTIVPQPKPILKLSGKEIGELDSRSVEMLTTVNRLREGQKLDVTLNTFGSDHSTYTLATTTLGNTIRVNQQALTPHSERRFCGESTTVEVGFKQSKIAMGVMLELDGTTKLAGIFTTNHKSSKEALMKAGLWKDGATFEATITSNITIAKIAIDPHSVQYPALGDWKNPERSLSLKEPTPIDTIADTYLKALKKQPSLLHRLDQEWTLPNGSVQKFSTLGLAVDESVADATHQWLTAQKIPHVRGEPTDPTIKPETERGYTVFRMKEADVSPNVLELMKKQCGEVLDAKGVDEATTSLFHQKLSTIPVQEPQASLHRERGDPKGASDRSNKIDENPQSRQPTKPETQSIAIANPISIANDSKELDAAKNAHSPFDLQNNRTQILAPLLAQQIKTNGFRDEKGEYVFENQDYLARWNSQHRLMTLFSTQEREPLLQARYDDTTKTWNPIPLTKTIAGNVQPRLSEDDVEKLQRALLSYTQLYEQLSNNVPKSNEREFLISVAQAALNNGFDAQETQRILEVSPFYQRVGQKLDEKEAQNFLNNIIDIAAYQQKHGSILPSEQLKQNKGKHL
jgi:hypothetical protein